MGLKSAARGPRASTGLSAAEAAAAAAAAAAQVHQTVLQHVRGGGAAAGQEGSRLDYDHPVREVTILLENRDCPCPGGIPNQTGPVRACATSCAGAQLRPPRPLAAGRHPFLFACFGNQLLKAWCAMRPTRMIEMFAAAGKIQSTDWATLPPP